MSEYKYISIPISYLEKKHISKKSFMQNSIESQDFIKNFTSKLPPYVELKNTFLINSNFILAFKNKENVTFENNEHFNTFCDFIESTKYKNLISINKINKEISISKDIPPIFYKILYEFLI